MGTWSQLPTTTYIAGYIQGTFNNHQIYQLGYTVILTTLLLSVFFLLIILIDITEQK